MALVPVVLKTRNGYQLCPVAITRSSLVRKSDATRRLHFSMQQRLQIALVAVNQRWSGRMQDWRLYCVQLYNKELLATVHYWKIVNRLIQLAERRQSYRGVVPLVYAFA